MLIEIPFFGRVSNEWLVSRTAGILFAVSAFIVLAEVPVIVFSKIPATVLGNVLQIVIGAVTLPSECVALRFSVLRD
jgi:hypothetical protein